MSRYNNSQNGGSNGGNDNDYDDDDITLKIKEYSTVRLTPDNANGFRHDQYGASFITNYSDAEILDGIVLRREDKPQTWNVYSADKFFNLNPEDGLVYENFDEGEGYTNEMSAQDILEHPRVAGHSTTGGTTDYYFEPVGVVIEAAEDIAIYDDADVETTDEPAIKVGSASTLLSNNSWVRTYAKKMAQEGDAVVNDNGEDPTPREEDDKNPKYNDFEWLATEDPTLRSELEGRTLELWVTRETTTFDDGEEQTYRVPNLMDTKTGNFVTIDNGISNGDDAEADSDKAAATDGGTMAQSGSTDSATSSSSTTSSESSNDSSGTSDDFSGGLPENVPDKLDDLIDYMARNADDGEVAAGEVRSFAEDEVENSDDIDWEAAAEEATRRAN
jgi:hypothetical protein